MTTLLPQFDIGGTSSVNRPINQKLAETPSVTDFGAIGDNTTVNTAAFTAMEADTTNYNFYVPAGNFLTGLAKVTKNYYGVGTVINTNADGFGNPAGVVAQHKTPGITSANAMSLAEKHQNVDVYIGDSIQFGAYVQNYQTYVYLIQEMLNTKSNRGRGSLVNGSNFGYYSTFGTTSNGTAGPLQDSLILSAGGGFTIQGSFIEYIGFYVHSASSSGTVTVTATNPITSATTTLNTYTITSGTGEPLIGPGTNATGLNLSGSNWTYTVTCTSGSVELTGLFTNGFDGGAVGDGPFIIRHAQSGYSTQNFANTTVLNSIKAQIPTAYQTTFPRLVIALGTNNIYNPSKATTSAQFKADLLFIINNFTYPNAGPVLCVPLRATNASFTPVLEPFDNYRQAVYEVARQYDLDVIDFSELDLASTGAYVGDGLHPNLYGQAFMADYAYQKLYANAWMPPQGAALALGTGVTTSGVGADYPIPGVRISANRQIQVFGTVNVSALAKGDVIATLPSYYAPVGRRVFSCSTNSSFGTAVVAVKPTGEIILIDYSASSITYLSLDTIQFCGFDSVQW